MGQNEAIKRFSPYAEGYPLELFPSKRGKAPLVRALLATPWISAASELRQSGDSCTTRRMNERIEVVWRSAEKRVASFTRRGSAGDGRARIYSIDAVVQTWAIERFWWSPEERVSKRFWRVSAQGGVYDLAYDGHRRAWHLVGVQD